MVSHVETDVETSNRLKFELPNTYIFSDGRTIPIGVKETLTKINFDLVFRGQLVFGFVVYLLAGVEYT